MQQKLVDWIVAHTYPNEPRKSSVWEGAEITILYEKNSKMLHVHSKKLGVPIKSTKHEDELVRWLRQEKYSITEVGEVS